MLAHVSDVNSGALHLARKPPGFRARFVTMYDWMLELGLPPAVVNTYAVIWSRKAGRQRTRVKDIAQFAQRSERTVRRHVAALVGVGLLETVPRYRDHQRLGNDYRLLWRHDMPVALKGPLCTGVPTDDGVSREADTDDLREEDTDGRHGRSPVTGQLSSDPEPEKHTDRTATGRELRLPSGLATELRRVAPGQVADCLRILAEDISGSDAAHADRVAVVAARLLIDACDKGEIANPAGLLRSRLVPAAVVTSGEHWEELSRMRAALQSLDESLPTCRTGFVLRRGMLQRSQAVREYVRRHVHCFGVEPSDVPELWVSDPELGGLLKRVHEFQEAVRIAKDLGDAMSEAAANRGLLELEQALDAVLRKRDSEA